MSKVVRFPAAPRIPATTIPREEFERLAELALDVVDRIVALLDDQDGEDEGDREPSLGAPKRPGGSQVTWFRRDGRDLNLD